MYPSRHWYTLLLPRVITSTKLGSLLKNSIKLKSNHSIRNNTDFIEKIKHVKLQANYKIASFDTVGLYTNIPRFETLTSVKLPTYIKKTVFIDANICNPNETNEMISLLEVILDQNNFMFNNNFHIQNKGLAMELPLFD